MKKPIHISQVKIYNDVTFAELNQLLNQGVINLKEFFTIMEEGKLEKDKFKIYKDKNYKL